jgi:hypothetical protein
MRKIIKTKSFPNVTKFMENLAIKFANKIKIDKANKCHYNFSI